MSCTGASATVAAYYLSISRNDPAYAVNAYFDSGCKPPPKGGLLGKKATTAIDGVYSFFEESVKPWIERLRESSSRTASSDVAVPPTSSFLWDPLSSSSCTQPNLYKITGAVAAKEAKPNYIYNLEAGPPSVSSNVAFGIKILSVGKNKYSYDALGLKDDGVDTHLRCAPNGGPCVALQTGQLWCGGVTIANQKFSRPPVAGSTILIRYDVATKACTFTLSDTDETLTAIWSNRPSGRAVRPAIAVRDLGYSFELVSATGARGGPLPMSFVLDRWTSSNGGLLGQIDRHISAVNDVIKECEGNDDCDDFVEQLRKAVEVVTASRDKAVDLIDRAKAKTGGVLGDRLRAALSAASALKGSFESEAKVVDAFDESAPGSVNCQRWLQVPNGLFDDAKKSVPSHRALLQDATRQLNEDDVSNDDDDDDESAAATKSTDGVKKGKMDPVGKTVVRKLVTELTAVCSFLEMETTRLTPKIAHIASLTPQPETIQYVAPTSSSAIDWADVTQWIVLKRGEFCKTDTDPVTLEAFGDADEDVVELSCSTASIRCVMLRSTATQSLANSGTCPTCKMRYPCVGQQPTGTMRINPQFNTKCAGYPTVGSWVLSYQFGGGTQTDRNIRPGQRYQGTTRTCYVPLNKEGTEAKELLKAAFKQGHLFRVGDSITTGSQNQTVWGGIHQKTALSGGAAGHGWPDPEYFSRLRNECANAGVFGNKWIEEVRKEQAKWKLDRQKSAEEKCNEDEKDDNMVLEDNVEDTIDESTEKRREEIESELLRVANDLRTAMQKGDRKAIMEMMKKRQALTAEKAAL